MVENRRWLTVLAHAVLWLGVLIIVFPVFVTLMASTQSTQQIMVGAISLVPGDSVAHNYWTALTQGATGTSNNAAWKMMLNSAVVAMLIACGKIFLSLLAAYAIIFFALPLRMVWFWLIFLTLMLPVEVRILPTYKVISDLALLDTYTGLSLPLIASATGTLLFRQFFMTLPNELVEAAKIDGAGPFRFFKDVVIPLSKTNIAALFVIQFIYGWNQYLWPLLITTKGEMETIVIGIRKMMADNDSITDWGVVMATTMLAMIPPVLVVIFMQRWFVKGLVDNEK
ncbi:sn-glycerol-3-phosphate ABC transporter permease UgpE [Lacibacterium aquatile]|uniref:sn-glycerol-3-phosphate transport system permease protein UgpE n=1 Tax=Lacibacterium aquatile TaxID=1168082 RepID=A0ABW5DZR2_9PROT